jgi:hypothetical protein
MISRVTPLQIILASLLLACAKRQSTAKNLPPLRGVAIEHADEQWRSVVPADCPSDAVFVAGGRFDVADGLPGIWAYFDAVPPIADMCLDRTEVTAASYLACVTKGACSEPDTTPACIAANSDPERPAVCITWKQADAYCKRLGRELPSAFASEWARRGGARWTPPWNGIDRSQFACGEATHACKVGTHHPEPAGTYDLTGNAGEWTSTLMGSVYAVAGGSFQNSFDELATSAQRVAKPQTTAATIGFRCVIVRISVSP